MSDVSLRLKSTVVISGELPSKEVISQSIGLEHDAGAPYSSLIGNAFQVIRQVGGLSVDSLDGQSMDFYPLVRFDRINFSVKTLVITVGNSLRN